ncbi:MAG: hypothetical protein ACE5IT_08620 [bacterium]
MGTASGVKKVEHFFDDTFLVTSGDGLTNINLSNVISFHRKRRAFGTMVPKCVDTPYESGIALIKRTALFVVVQFRDCGNSSPRLGPAWVLDD